MIASATSPGGARPAGTGSDREGPRVAFFTHDTFGLGHVRRCSHLARRIARHSPDSAILLVTGSPFALGPGALPRNADVVKIPTIARTGSAESRPPHLPLPLDEVTALRRGIAHETLVRFAPDVFVVDNFPLGSRGELREALESLRAAGTSTVLGLRDILDHPAEVRRQWSRQGVHDVLERHFDRIVVYGLREVFDVVEAYALPPAVAEKVRYCGYLTDVGSAVRGAGEPLDALGLEPPRAVVCVGGGGDGLPLLRAAIDALRDLAGISALLVTGPLMAEHDRESIERAAAGMSGVAVRRYLPDLARYLAGADLVVSMGGYNTVAEIVALGCRAVIVPRNWRYGEHARGTEAGVEGEQVLRAERLRAAGLVEVVEPQGLDGARLGKAMRAALERAPAQRASLVGADGLEAAALEILGMARARGR